jgi:hypothetical protein
MVWCSMKLPDPSANPESKQVVLASYSRQIKANSQKGLKGVLEYYILSLSVFVRKCAPGGDLRFLMIIQIRHGFASSVTIIAKKPVAFFPRIDVLLKVIE